MNGTNKDPSFIVVVAFIVARRRRRWMDGLVDSIRTDRRVASRRVRLDGRLDFRLDV